MRENNNLENSLFGQDEVLSQPLAETADICDNPFKNRKVIIKGNFNMSLRAMKYEIQKRGGSVESGDVTKNIHYLLLGKGVTEECLENYRKLVFNGFNVKILYQEDFDAILAGNGGKYMVESEIVKNLHLTKKHYDLKHVDYQSSDIDNEGKAIVRNRIYGKNLYVGACIPGNHTLFSQMLGLVGVYSCAGLSDNTDIIILSQSAFDALEAGTPHEEITLIQDVYNRGLAITFDYKMTTEAEILAWLKLRIDTFDDTVLQKVYQSYFDSIK